MKKQVYKIIIKSALRLHSFSYRLASFFSSKLENGPHPKHRLTNYHQFFIDNINPGDSVLDVGCGKGELCLDVSRKVKEVVGIDIEEKNIKTAKEKFSAKNIKYITGDILKDFPDKKFDVIILSNVLEHIENRVDFLEKVKKLAPKILIRAPMINRDWITLYKKELGLEWRLDKGHFTEYTLESLKKEFERAGLKIQNYNVKFGEIWAIIN